MQSVRVHKKNWLKLKLNEKILQILQIQDKNRQIPQNSKCLRRKNVASALTLFSQTIINVSSSFKTL